MDNGDYQVVKEVKGKNTKHGRTPDRVWMHPILFTKFAMWINPRFEVKAVKFIYDEMIKYRNEAGDAYKELSSAVNMLVPSKKMPEAMKKVAEALNWIVFNAHAKLMRNKGGDEKRLRELWRLEHMIAENIKDGLISTYDDLIVYLRRKYMKLHPIPKVLQ